jgi:hypothetical protein
LKTAIRTSASRMFHILSVPFGIFKDLTI